MGRDARECACSTPKSREQPGQPRSEPSEHKLVYFHLASQGIEAKPPTVSTDYDTSDKLYFEPLTLEDVMGIYERENCYGVIVQFGGQTPLNLAMRLKKAGANVVGTSPEDIDLAEDRDFFKQLVDKVGIKQAVSGIAHNVEEALAIVEKIGSPVLVRPSFVLGGRGYACCKDTI